MRSHSEKLHLASEIVTTCSFSELVSDFACRYVAIFIKKLSNRAGKIRPNGLMTAIHQHFDIKIVGSYLKASL